MADQITLDYEPQPRQQMMHTSPARLILYGGAVGGGKSHALRWEGIRWALKCPGIQIYLFRRTLGELEDNHVRQLKEAVPAELAKYSEQRKSFEFKNGSTIRLCYCEKEHDVERYQGAEIHVLLIDEATHMTEYQINYLIGRNRLGGFRRKVQENLRQFLPRSVFASNPGNVGHSFLKMTFIDAAPPEALFYSRKYKDMKNDADKGRLTQFIPAKMQDNMYIDSDYAGSLGGLPPELQQALVNGDWDSVVGQALHTLNRGKHMLRPFEPPRTVTHFMSLDWGSAAPFSVGWYFVSDGLIIKEREGWPERWIPPGALVRYAEWYGWDGKRPNHGLRYDARTVARRILDKENEAGFPPMDYRVADSSMWSVNDGPSIAHNMSEATDGVLSMIRSRKSREHNYSEVLCRLAGSQNYRTDNEEGDYPMLYITANCLQFWRTVPILTFDSTNPEKGPETKQEDHVYDELAYACRSMPYITTESDRWQEQHGAAFAESMRHAQGQHASADPYRTT
tara:strand:- start:186 stop:1712 length:1527 start_codon:yes stop_codon:yes gene_type:complete